MASNLLTLANSPGEITQRGAEHEHNSVIDLVWYNKAVVQNCTFTNLQIDWEGSLGSDHALLQVDGRPCSMATQPIANVALGFIVNPDQKEEWIKAFKAGSSPFLLPFSPTAEDVEQAAAVFTKDLHNTNEQIFHRHHPFHPKVAPWWNAACALAVWNLCSARDPSARATAQACLKGTVQVVKCKWADEYIEKAKLWEVVDWRHRHRVSKVPSLKGPDGLVHTHEGVADLLSQRFFAKTPPKVEMHFHDDPP